MSQAGPNFMRRVPCGAAFPEPSMEGPASFSGANAGNQTAREPLTNAPVGSLARPTVFNDSDFRTLAACSDAVSFVVDQNGYFIYSDGKSLLALGFASDQVMGQSAFEIYEHVPPVINGIRQALEGNSSHCNVTVGGLDFDVSFTPRLSIKGKVIGVIGSGTNVTRQTQAEAALTALVTTSLRTSGDSFFKQVAKALSQWLNMDCVILSQITETGRAKALVMYLDGEFVDEYEYGLAGSPCETVDKKGYCAYQSGVDELFSDDPDLKTMGFVSYVGVPIMHPTEKKAHGILCALGRHEKKRLPTNLPTSVLYSKRSLPGSPVS